MGKTGRLPLGAYFWVVEAAARADPRSWLWEEGQKGTFVLIKAKHSKTGLTRFAKISFPFSNCQMTVLWFRIFYQKYTAEKQVCVGFALYHDKGSLSLSESQNKTPTTLSGLGSAARILIHCLDTRPYLLFVSTGR